MAKKRIDAGPDELDEGTTEREMMVLGAPPEAEPDPLRLVKVRNDGRYQWVGTDFVSGTSSLIRPGEVGTLSFKRVEMLIDDLGPDGIDGHGPFVIVEE